MDYTKKNGLLFSSDLKIVFGTDSSSGPFDGKVPYGVQDIRDEAFSSCDNTEITLPDSVTELGSCLFENSTNLRSVKLPAEISELPPYIFSGCSSLTRVTLPNKLVSIPEGIYYGCSSLMEIPLRAGIQEIPENACCGCTSVKSLILPSSVTKIGARAFADCTGLETVILPEHLYELAPDAFDGCTNIRNIRIDGENHLFYIKDDGLYEKSLDGEDKCRLKLNKAPAQQIDFFQETVNEEVSAEDLADEFETEEDDTFSAEIGAAPEEMGSVVNEASVVREAFPSDMPEPVAVEEQKTFMEAAETPAAGLEVPAEEEKFMADEDMGALPGEENFLEEEKVPQEISEVDKLFYDIMGEEKERNSSVEDVSVSAEETAVLSQVMSVMTENTPINTSVENNQELTQLFASADAAQVPDEEVSVSKNYEVLDSKTQILIDSAEFCNVIVCDDVTDIAEDFDLFVIAEKTVKDADGNECFSPKLEKCCRTVARIHDLKRILMFKGLPADNEEFKQFYYHFINKRNVILACQASNPKELSDYGKAICEQSRISLNKDELMEQRKLISVKTNTLIKIVLQDNYEL